MARKKILSVALATALTVTTVWNDSPSLYQSVLAKAQEENTSDAEEEVVVDAEEVNAANYGLCDNTKDGAILHAFCWSFNTIKENMEDIAAAGYTTVQTSPINECLAGEGGGMELFGNGKWYYHYQPTDWKIGNYQLGSRDDYKAMCAEADKYGIKIISDVLPNHTTPTLSAVSQELANAAGGMGAGQLYHSSGFREIGNYKDRYECTLGQMGGLPDVNTENQGFQAYYLKFCNDVIECGGDGFRYDTAKHIGVHSDPKDSSNTRGENDFWDIATGKKEVNGVKLNRPDNFFIYGEVLQDEGIPYAEYASYMEMTASGYGYVLRDDNLRNNSLNVNSISDWRHATPDKIVTWVESHDTYCNEHNSGWMSDWQIRAGWAVIAARSNGTPLFFSRPDGSNGSSGNYWGNNRIGAKGNDQFKHPEVAACNHFRNAMVGENEYLSNPNGNSSVLVIERGNRGAVIINMGSAASNIKLSKVADGTYDEEVSGSKVTVSGGVLDYTVPGGTIAVVYDTSASGSVKNPSVSASKASGSTFSEAFELTLTAKNADSATYETSEGDSGSFTGSKKITIGSSCEIGDTVTVKVTAKGAEGSQDFSETFTYTMAETPAYKMMIRVKKSDFDTAPNLYLYDSAEKALNGAWPGNAMTAEGDYYVFTSDSLDSATAILKCGDWRSTADMQPGLSVSGCVEYDKASNTFKTFTLPVKTKAPTKTTEPTKEPTKAPEKTTAPTKEPTKEPEKTTAPTKEPTKAPEKTTAPTKEPAQTTAPTKENIQLSKEDGTSFNTETMDVTITLSGATKGSYSIDNGPEKSFVNSVTAKVGQGKIADSDVTLEVKTTVNGKEVSKKVTYRKVFDEDTANVKASAIVKIQSAMEIVKEVAGLNGAAETKGFYATNPNSNVGKEATITIDGSFSDWSEDMLIAQGAAWDIANNFKGGHENCVLDDYALYAAWDDDNLYIGWQMVNTTDTWARPGDGPLSDGGRVLDVPLMLALNVGNRPAMTGKMANGKLIWDALDVSFETRVDNILLMSGKVGLGTPGYFIAADDSGGASYDPNYCLSFKTEGISYKMAEGCLPSSIMMLEGATDVSDIYDTSKYVDAKSKGHDTTFDSFYEINIPLKTLGIDKAYLEENGVGVMQIATRGTSGIDCLPRDPSMMDNATGDCAVDPSTSHEKDDADIITVPLAAVGNMKAGGEGSGASVATKAPTKTDAPTKTEAAKTETPVKTEAPEKTEAAKTKAPEKTEAPAKTEAPEKTEAVKTKAPEKTEAPEKTKAPVKTDAPMATEKTNTVSGFTVNFGADRSSPQYNTTELTLKAIAKGVSGECTYEFAVDDKVVQEASEEDSYIWKGTPGSHKIKVTVEDSKGNKRVSEKDYVIEAVSDIDSSNTDATAKPNNDVPNNGSNTTQSKLEIGVKASHAQSDAIKAGTTMKFTLEGTGGTAPYKYTIKIEGGSYGTNPYLLLDNSSNTTAQWTPLKKGTYKFYFIVQDASGDKTQKFVRYEISSCVSVSKLKASKTVVKKNKTVKFSMAATSELSSASNMLYQLKAKRAGAAKSTIIKKYSKSKVYTWRAKKKGKYTITMTAKDTKGNTASKSIKITVK